MDGDAYDKSDEHPRLLLSLFVVVLDFDTPVCCCTRVQRFAASNIGMHDVNTPRDSAVQAQNQEKVDEL